MPSRRGGYAPRPDIRLRRKIRRFGPEGEVAIFLLQSGYSLGVVGQERDLPICRRKIPRRAVIFGAIALGGSLTLPRRGRGQNNASGTAPKVLIFAVSDLVPGSADLGDIAHGIAEVISDDLGGSGRFTPIDPSALPAINGKGARSEGLPQFDVWRSADVDVLITGRVNLAGTRLRSEFFIWDVASSTAVQGEMYIGLMADWRRMARAMSGVIYEHFVGEKHDFNL
jgi:hypothetical protein